MVTEFVALLVLIAILLFGFIKIAQIAWQEAMEVFQQQLKAEVFSLDKSEAVEKSALLVETLPSAEVLTVKTKLRAMRKVATQRGIRNTGRMRKAQLLGLLEIRLRDFGTTDM